jgi:hypothetical protein
LQEHRVIRRISLLLLCVWSFAVNDASAQNWSFDARKIGLGSPDSGNNLASRMIEEEYDYRVIVLPFGLIQVFRDMDRLNPSNDEFDFVLTIEYAAAPLHYTFRRHRSDSADEFITDITNGELSRDLNDYKGFILVNQPPAAGLTAPQWGKTFKVVQGGGSFQGIYVGAGAYGSLQTASTIDERLTEILRADERIYFPLTQLTAQNSTQGQAALAIAGGYRAAIAFPVGVGLGTEREGLYIAANYNYLHGIRYHDIDSRLRLDTDSAGLLTANLNPALPPPLFISRVSADAGAGMAIDLGLGVVINHWEFGIGANGVGNFIQWTDAEQTSYFQADLVQGNGDLSELPAVPVGDVRVELPVEYRANAAYDVDRWAAVAEFARGLQGKSFHAGGELRLGAIDVRGGAAYSRELWSPSGGVGLNMSPGIALDLAVYANSANVERKRNPALALSLRFNR